MNIVYISMTGNVEHFVNQLAKLNKSIKITELKNGKEKVKDDYLLITHTTGVGEMPRDLVKFLMNDSNRLKCKGVIGSGNRNWGEKFCKGAHTASAITKAPLLHTFEMRGNKSDIDIVTNILKRMEDNNKNVKMD